MKKSIKNQIIVAVLVSQVVLAIGLTLAVVLYSRAQLLAGFDVMLEGRADSILAVIHDSEDGNQALILDRSKLNVPGRDLFEVWDDNGTLIWRSHNWQGAPKAVLTSLSPTFELHNGPFSYRGIVMRKATIFDEEDNRPAPRNVTITYAASTRELDRRISKIGLFAAGSSLLLLLLAGLFAAHGVTRGLAPVRELATEAARVSAHNWTFNPPQSAREKNELAPLSNALDTTLAGLQRAFDRERQFIADAAHELKTAVAILKSSLQLLVYQPRSNDEYRSGIGRSLEDCDRIEALVCNTLSLARAEQQADEQHSGDLQYVDLVQNCERSVADLKPLAQGRGIELQRVAGNEAIEAIVKADSEGLYTVWLNLLQNAIQHSPAGSRVILKVATSGTDTISVIVEDSGTGIPAEELPYVFNRFHRGDCSRSRSTGGFGLGLSICKAIVESFGGRIQITSPNGSGTRVSVTLPAVARPVLVESTSS
jgi:signal transduction histidine kinase